MEHDSIGQEHGTVQRGMHEYVHSLAVSPVRSASALKPCTNCFDPVGSRSRRGARCKVHMVERYLTATVENGAETWSLLWPELQNMAD